MRTSCTSNMSSFLKSFKTLKFCSFIYQTNPFWIQLVYLLFLSVSGYLALKISTPRSPEKLNDLDIFFTSVSSATSSSMATLEMEVFSNTQLIIITSLMLFGGEVFISMLDLLFSLHKTVSTPQSPQFSDQELGLFSGDSEQKPENYFENNNMLSLGSRDGLNFAAIKCLGHVVLGYLLVVHFIGSSLVAVYAILVPSVRIILAEKGLYLQTFSMFVTVSTFANAGFLPTNENMVVFKKNSGLLMILIPQVLLGNTLYAPSLRFLIWVLEKITKREEFTYLLKDHNNREIGYGHLMPNVRCLFVAITAFGFITVQFVVFCCLEWNSSLMDGMNAYEKIVAVIFQVVNARHSGESVFDLSAISPAILVIFVVMMYLPSYTSYCPRNEKDEAERSGRKLRKKKKKVGQLLIFSQLSYLIMAIILVCIVEGQKLKNDPLNFNVFTITIEVISAYGNVGFSTGYSCERQIKEERSCKNEWTGFVGKWSNSGKFILILVMFFGKLKKFSKNGGQTWKLS
ncbi:Cation transporter HKT8 [Euphorbia peplus]|nr:Cation transporter HKT8 [Euphorbia peplus]